MHAKWYSAIRYSIFYVKLNPILYTVVRTTLYTVINPVMYTILYTILNNILYLDIQIGFGAGIFFIGKHTSMSCGSCTEHCNLYGSKIFFYLILLYSGHFSLFSKQKIIESNFQWNVLYSTMCSVQTGIKQEN